MDKTKKYAKKCLDLAPLFIRQMKAEIRLAAKGKLTHPQYRILVNIYRGLNTVGQIADNHGISQPAMSKMVEALVVKGFLKRKNHETDRRQILLEMTPKGEKTFLQVRERAAVRMSLTFKKMDFKEFQEFAQCLDQLESFLLKIQKIKETA